MKVVNLIRINTETQEDSINIFDEFQVSNIATYWEEYVELAEKLEKVFPNHKISYSMVKHSDGPSTSGICID